MSSTLNVSSAIQYLQTQQWDQHTAMELFSISTQTATHAYVCISQEESLDSELTRQQVQEFHSFSIRIHVHSLSHTGVYAHFVSRTLSRTTHRFVLDLLSLESEKPLGDGCLGGAAIVGGRLRVGGGGGWETRTGLGPTFFSCPPSWVGGGGGSGREEIRTLSVVSLGGPGGGGRGLELIGVVLVGGGGGLRPPKEAVGDGLGLFCDGRRRVGGGGGALRGIVGLTLVFGLLARKDCGGEGVRTGGGRGLAVDGPGVVLDGGGGGIAFVVLAGFGRTKFGEDGGLFIESPLVFLLMLFTGGGAGGFRPGAGGGVGRFRPGRFRPGAGGGAGRFRPGRFRPGAGGGAGRFRPGVGGGAGGFRPGVGGGVGGFRPGVGGGAGGFRLGAGGGAGRFRLGAGGGFRLGRPGALRPGGPGGLRFGKPGGARFDVGGGSGLGKLLLRCLNPVRRESRCS